MQTLRFIPKPEYHEGKIFCSYEQFDTFGNLLYENNEVHEEILVNYLSEPLQEVQNVGEFKVSRDQLMKAVNDF